jgi:Holliday junction resolvase RusA-like endonuclease
MIQLANFVVPGVPKAKGRPRMTRAGHAYTPAATAQAEQDFLVLAMRHFPRPLSGPLRIDLSFTFPVPASWSKKKQAAALGLELAHESRPDLDNLIKLVLDALNGRAWVDDRQIYNLSAAKCYGQAAETWVLVWGHEENAHRSD